MGGTSTHQVTLDQLHQANLGICIRYEEVNYYFLDENNGLYCLPKDKYDLVERENAGDDTKILKLPLTVICKYN